MPNPIIVLKPGMSLPNAPHFRVEAQVGQGRTSVVHQVRDLRSNRLFAAKIFAAENGRPTRLALERFEREIFMGVGLDHPSVMRLMSVVHYGHLPIPIYEYAAAGNLYELVVEFKHIVELDTALQWMTQIAEATEYLHGRNLIHRDIMPKNILVRDDGSVFLGDLGMALDRSAGARSEKYFPRNVAPIHVSTKQHQNPSEATEVDDIFSMGQTFFFMLTRQMPRNKYTDIRQFNPDCPEELMELINAMRHPDECHRPRTAKDVALQCRNLFLRRAHAA